VKFTCKDEHVLAREMSETFARTDRELHKAAKEFVDCPSGNNAKIPHGHEACTNPDLDPFPAENVSETLSK